MRVVHICTTPTGAALRLHVGLRRLGVDSMLFSAEGRGDIPDPMLTLFRPPRDPLVRLRRRIIRTLVSRDFRRYRSSRPPDAGYFFDDRSPHGADMLPQLPPCDVVHLHAMVGLVDFRAFFREVPLRTPVVRTLHDMTSFTGGCHESAGCERFRAQCGACPLLGSRQSGDLSSQIWHRKHAAFAAVPQGRLSFVAPSRWMAERARSSSLLRDFPVTVIPLALDVETFRPRDRAMARDLLGLPPDAQVVLFVSTPMGRPDKGFAFLAQALDGLAQNRKLLLLTMGTGEPPVPVRVPHHHIGFIGHEVFLALIYNAADVVVVPSLGDNFPQVCLEAAACGVPVVGFAVGGIPEITRHGISGVLTPPKDVDALRVAIQRLLENPAERGEMGVHGRRIAVEEYALDVQAQRYKVLYEDLLKPGGTHVAHDPATEIAGAANALSEAPYGSPLPSGTDVDRIHA